jgi:putative nucleotidyltransferase with HDIG domain
VERMSASELVIDVAKIKRAAHNAISLNILTYTLPHDIEVYTEEILNVFLTELGQEKLQDYLVYCLRELAVNAKKANTKRVYFDSRGLDIDDPDQYEEGMTNFKQDTIENIAWYLQKQKEKGYYIKIIFQAKGSNIILEVRNNVQINKKEYVRIHDKIARSRQYTSLEEAMQQVLDPSEGAGLGLVILVLMLKKIGLNEECFDIWAEAGETIARITVPIASTRIESVSALTDEVVKEITNLPQFPENIVKIQRLIADPDSQIVEIAKCISTDLTMTAGLLKLVNSAAYMMAKKVDNIVDAVKLVGLRGIKNLLYTYGTFKILDDGAADKKQLWEHSYRTAYYAYNLAKNFRAGVKGLLDDAYVGGMLHDIGKIIFASVHPDMLEKIHEFCRSKDLPTDTFENMIAGLNHAEIGARISEKWNFPESLVAAIRYHHEPGLETGEYREVVNVVYLANVFCEYGAGNMFYDQIEPSVLQDYGFTGEKHFRTIVDKMSEGFDQESGRSVQEAGPRK